MAYEIQKLMVMSSAHLTRKTLYDIEMDHVRVVAYPNEYGAFVMVEFDPTLNDFKGQPKDLKACRELANSFGCSWIKFDRDGPAVRGLPIYDC